MMFIKNLLVLVFLIIEIFGQIHPDVGLNVKQLIRKYGYPLEVHQVTTEDGYVLELHRIPFGRKNANVKNRPAALVIPGNECSSDIWVNMGPEKSLGFILADRGYDVWLGNTRGTVWSRKHIKLDPDVDVKEFWDFSYHEHGFYDLPAFTDHILHESEEQKLFYIAHSQAVTSFFVMASERPQYNDKIRLAALFMSVFYVGNTEAPYMRLFAPFEKIAKDFTDILGFYEILPRNRFFTILGQIFCNDESPVQFACEFMFHSIGGYGSTQLNKTTIPIIASTTPAGASAKQFFHLLQSYKTDTPQQYDYGIEENLIRYGQKNPPVYNITKVTAPIALYYGEQDWLAVAEDVDRTAAALSNVAKKQMIKGFNHLDYIWGKNVVEMLYNGLLELMQQY